MMLARSVIGCWDNSTCGLDAATALEFVQALRMSADVFCTTHAVAIYQASQAIYDLFDKVIVLYEGREIFFGPTREAKSYFEAMGWVCPSRQTTGDFLTSVTNPSERLAKAGYESRVPRTPDEFEHIWRNSEAHKKLEKELQQHESDAANSGFQERFKQSHKAQQSKRIRVASPYIVNVPMQLKICLKRAFQRLRNDKPSTLTVVLGQVVMALVVGSVFFGAPEDTNSFFARGSTIFFATLLNALIAVTEINGLYQQRLIIEKQASYA